ncbi:zinc finger MYM-type protein 1-like [Centruroides vittatus]|uniref:zinc finger MYM-type protein 1-like n=1 Tax=Centruroides vittatus TaxID=120091 RepID=UPI00351091AF
MSSYKHLSGSEERKRKADRDKVAKQMKRSLDKFLTVDGEQLQQSSSFSQISPAQTPETSFVSETILQKDQQEKPSNSVCEDETKGENINLKSSQTFRGKNEVFFSENNGNYIGALEYLSEFDPFLREHMKKYANCGTGTINYLSSTICDEFISIISKDLQLTIVNEIKEAKFYSLIIHSTPDISHVDQLTVIICYVLPSGIKERFLGFLPIFSHTGEKLKKVILEFLNNIDLDITNCRGQSYDNAFNMSSKYKGLQSRIKQHIFSAHFIPCANHSLNLIGNAAAESYMEMTTFFNIVQELWSARSDAVKSLKENYEEIKHYLRHFSSNKDEKPLTRSEAADLHKKT